MASLTAFTRKYDPVGKFLADALPTFSLDLCGLIASFLICGTAKLVAIAESLPSIQLKDKDKIPTALAYCAENDSIWVGMQENLDIYSTDCKWLGGIAPAATKKKPIKHTSYTGFTFANRYAYSIQSECSRITQTRLNGHYAGYVAITSGWSVSATGLAISNDHQFFYVVGHEEYETSAIAQISMNGRLVRKFGHGDDNYGVAVSQKGEVYGFGRRAVHIYDGNGKFIRDRQLQHVNDLTFDKDGNIVTALCAGYSMGVGIFREDGSAITYIQDSQLVNPLFVCIDIANRIYVADKTAVIKVFGFPID